MEGRNKRAPGCHLNVLLVPGTHGTVRVCTLVPEEVGPQRGQAETPNSSLGSG